MSEATYNISEVGKLIGRVPHTIRQWESNNRLPEHLRSKRNDRGWRYWTASQVEGLKNWIIVEDMTPGKAFRKKDSDYTKEALKMAEDIREGKNIVMPPFGLYGGGDK